MAQRVEPHPLDAAFAALLANGLDGAGERHVRVVAADHADGRRSISLVRVVQALPQATLLDNVSNVAWFGRSIAPQPPTTS